MERWLATLVGERVTLKFRQIIAGEFTGITGYVVRVYVDAKIPAVVMEVSGTEYGFPVDIIAEAWQPQG